jgi:hypothetical protein
MAKVWVQVWTAQVLGSVQVEQSELQKVAGLESVKPMVPMLVEVKDSVEVEALRSALVWEKVKVQQLESVLHSQTVTATEKVPMSETEKESALSKGWGWVLGSAQQLPEQSQQEQQKLESDPLPPK